MKFYLTERITTFIDTKIAKNKSRKTQKALNIRSF